MFCRPQDYTVGWIAALELEYVVACEMLDEEYTDNIPSINSVRDPNNYTFGRIYKHNIVIACLPRERCGTISAALVAERMRNSFPNIQIGLLVGIGGAAPSVEHDIRLGDVVVGSPSVRHGGVLQYDFGKAIQSREFEETGHLNSPPENILNALSRIGAEHKRKGHQIRQTIDGLLERNPRLRPKHARPTGALDRLYKSSYLHKDEGCDCQELYIKDVQNINPSLVSRTERDSEKDHPAIHYGLIASANTLMKDALARDVLVQKHDVLCFEMEAAGLVNHFPCVVIRGMCDYADSHKNDIWQGYAAATAAAYARELLGFILSTISVDDSTKYHVQFSLEGLPCVKKFIPRSVEMEPMTKALLPTNENTRRKIFVILGMGGIGKTQIAIEFMRKYHTRFTAVFWLDGSSEDTLKQSLVKHSRTISLDQNSADTKEEDVNVLVKRVLDWLTKPDNTRWLMVFDNVDREQKSIDPLAYDIKQYFPSSDHGSILITTRLTGMEQLGDFHEVKKVNNETAQAILESRYQVSCDNSTHERLFDRLGGLPLAIAQAGSYLHKSGVSIDTYIRLYDEQSVKVAEALHDSDTLLDDYPGRSIWTTWNISYNAVSMKDKHVANLLVLWSFLDRNDLWYGLFERARVSSEASNAKALSHSLGSIADQELSFISAMSLLRGYSLIEGTENTLGYTMHTVVHRWTYFYHGTKHGLLRLLALRIIGCAVPRETERDYVRLQQRLLPHANMCFDRVLEEKERTPQDQYYNNNFESPIDLVDKEDCLFATHMLGLLFWYLGKLTQAEKVYMRALAGKEEALGSKHASTLRTVNNLGLVYKDQGKLAEAEQMYIRALASKEEVLGPKHASTLQTINNLGALYIDQGKLADAEQMYMRALAGYEEVLGPKHAYTFNVANNLSDLYTEQGKLVEAEKILLGMLADCEEVLRPKDIYTLSAVNNLGVVYKDQGKLFEAEKILLGALADCEEVLGPKHAYTLDTVNNLGEIYYKQGKFDEAEEMLLRAQRGYEEVMRPELVNNHIFILQNMHALGDLYAKTQPDESRAMYEKALTGFTKIKGPLADICITLKQRIEELGVTQLQDANLIDPESSAILEGGSQSKSNQSRKRKLKE